MVKKIGFALLACLPLALIVIATRSDEGSLGLFDYFNLLLYNTGIYPLYRLDPRSFLHFTAYFLLLIGGFYFVSEPIHLRSQGYGAMEVVRYPRCTAYLKANRRCNLKNAVLFTAALFAEILFAVLLFDGRAFFSVHTAFPVTFFSTASGFFCFAVRLISVLALFELWCEYLLYRIRFEVLLSIVLVLLCLLLQAGAWCGLPLLSLSFEPVHYVLTALCLLLYILSDLYILKQYRTKEMW